MELKKEATAAAAALPTFTYRTGFLGITAADKSWQISFSHEFHVHMYNYLDGNDSDGFTTGDIFMRRNRPFVYYCWNDCLYEIGFGLDMDDGDIANTQHTRFMFNLDKINPWLPKLEIADRGLEQPSYVQRSSSSSARVELTRDLLNDGAYDTLSHAGIGLGWLDKELGSGDFTLWTEYRIGSGFSQNTNSDTDRKQFQLKVGARPFSQTKNKWLQRLKLGIGWLATSIDDRSSVSRRLALRTDDRIGRIRTMDANNIGGGGHNTLHPGLEWGVGPYLFRTEMAYSKYDNDSTAFAGGDVKGFAWSLQNELFLWSPKGFLTGSSRTPNSVLVGWSFARADMDCNTGADCTPGDSTSSKGHLIKRELDVWYFLRPGLSVGAWWNWWSTPNMPTSLQRDVGCVNRRGSERVGKECDWHSLNLGLRANF
ncbi:MAG TPA: hypothetical protein VNN77_07680, partial [candidate division Zixibacteria bacterium]|nr:hypothetical protein [candidate division Zixibacteria bacterium]